MIFLIKKSGHEGTKAQSFTKFFHIFFVFLRVLVT